MNKDILPDQHYINQMRKRLWCGKECGKVAVMIGAGFSLNANIISQSSSKFLLWNELIKEMKNDLYPYEKIELNTAISEALKLASEYELVFGRQALDELILRALPDQNYVPGDLHKLILSLPWSDVFTTNYDTLLERTRMYIHDRKYDLVINSADLPTTSKPRIVKLHGSFPSSRPFIITEEDYRTYPKKFSAFINTVQQSIMENSLCLIGFSGDDPNFLNWIGWVRDNLGMNTPPIYFCGFVNQSIKRSLESRGIVPIDLSPLFTEDKYPGGSKHSKALEWLLLNLKNGKEFDIMKWPKLQVKTMKIVKEELPPIPVVDFEDIDSAKVMEILGNKLTKETLVELTELWQGTRLTYPGWVIALKSKREKIWKNTEMLYYEIMNSIKLLSFDERLNLFYELNWRFEISLMPITDDFVQKIDSIINEINPFENIISGVVGQITINGLEAQCERKFDRSLIREKWMELNFAIAKHAREEQNAVKFGEYMDKLQLVINQNIEWKAKWYYEKCLFNLTIFNQDEIRNILNEWTATNELPFWEIKRASILAEIGDLKEAGRIAEEALNKIRLMIRADQIDISILSQEGWAMVLIDALNYNVSERTTTDYSDRWAILSNYGCNPWQEIDILKGVLRSSVPNHDEENKISKEFDRGRISKHFSFGKKIKEEIKLSYAFLRILENAAVPLQCGNIKMVGKEVAIAAKWIKPYSPFWAISIMTRCDENDALKDSISRLEVATLPEEKIEQYYDIFVGALDQAIDNEPTKGYSHIFYSRQIQNLSEVVSRICIRFSREQLDKVLKVALKMYKSQRLQRDEWLNKYIGIVLNRIFSTMSDTHKADWLPELLKLSINMEEEIKVNDQNYKVDLFSYFDFSSQFKLKENYDIHTLKEYVNANLTLLKNQDKKVRERALLRECVLYNIKALTIEEEESFAQIIWGRVSEGTGLPDYSQLYNYSYLYLPIANDKNVKEIMLKYLLSKEIPVIYNETKTPEGKGQVSYSGGIGFTKYVREWVGSIDSLFVNDNIKIKQIELNNNNAASLLDKLYLWWQDQKSNLLSKTGLTLFGNREEHIDDFISFLTIVIASNLDSEDQGAINKVKSIINDIDNEGYETLSILPVTLNLGLYSEEEIKGKLTKALFSIDEKLVKSSIYAIVYWLWYGEISLISKVPNSLLDDLVDKLCWRKQPGIVTIIKYLIKIIDSLPKYLNDELIRKICVALQHLLYETDINSSLQEDMGNFIQDLDDLTEQRYYASKLSNVMCELIQVRGIDIPDFLKKWEVVGKSDPLPEVRNLWEA